MEVPQKVLALTNGLQEEANMGDVGSSEDGLHGDVGGEHEPLGEEASIDGPQDLNFDPKAIMDVIKELYRSSKCTKLELQ